MITIEVTDNEFWMLCSSLMESIESNKRHLQTWKGYKADITDDYFKPEKIQQSIEMYVRLVNEETALRHKLLAVKNQEPHPEFITAD